MYFISQEPGTSFSQEASADNFNLSMKNQASNKIIHIRVVVASVKLFLFKTPSRNIELLVSV